MQTQPKETRIVRNFNKHNIQDFQTKLSYKVRDSIFGENYVSKIFNNFQNSFLKIFYSSFPKKKIQSQKKTWMSKGIRTSINHKRVLYLRCINSNNLTLK